MKSRVRIFGCPDDMREYGLSSTGYDFPALFLQIEQSFDKINDLQNWAKHYSLSVLQSEEFLWLFIPQAKKSYYFNELEEKFQSLELPLNNIRPSQKNISSGNKKLCLDKSPVLMGILNVTPDSFSDGGLYVDSNKAVEHALKMTQSGVQIIDIGGESTRPGAKKITAGEEWERIGETIQRLDKELPDSVMISVDTYKSGIAEKALQHGANIINDISGLTYDPAMAEVAAQYNAPVILMHIKGTPENMQQNPKYEHVMDEILDFFDRQLNYALKNKVKQLILDPGIGFGKRVEDNFEIIRRFEEFSQFGYPTLLGSSRKSFIWHTLNVKPDETDAMSVMMNTLGIHNKANILRVHDIKLHNQMKMMLNLYQSGKSK